MKRSLKDRFRYWFDERMSRGTVSMIKMLTLATLLIVVVIAVIITANGMDDESGFLVTFWDSLATVINAWMPYSDDGGAGYVILTAIVAVVGLLFTSVLIGIIGSAIEERLTELRKGNSVILEKGHTVILGHTPGAYELINQLILAAAGKPLCLVIAEELEKDEMEDAIRENVEIPGNVRIICRNADITDPSSLISCTLPMAETILISPMDDRRTVKAVLAASKVLREAGASAVKIVAAVSKDEYLLPGSDGVEKMCVMLQTNDIIARIMAHSCSQPGLSEVFTDIFDFQGSEFYLSPFPDGVGLDFDTLSSRLYGGVPVGLRKNGRLLLGVSPEEKLEEGDLLLYFSENRDSIRLSEEDRKAEIPKEISSGETQAEREVLTMIGFNEVVDTVIRELPETTDRVILAGIGENELPKVLTYLKERPEITVTVFDGDISRSADLERLVRTAEHVLLLCDHELSGEDADLRNMLLLLKLREIKERLGLTFTVTTEMRDEKNRLLVASEDPTDFIVAGNMSSMILAQMAESPELYEVFREILANAGIDLCLKKAEGFGLLGRTVTTTEIRRACLHRGYVFLGILKNGERSREVCLNPDLREEFTPDGDDSLIVLGEK